MPACPQCGLTEWHDHDSDDGPVDEAVGVKSSQLLDDWEQNQVDLRAKMLEAAELASKATSIRNSLAARGITVTSDLPVLEDEEDEPPAPTPQTPAPALQETRTTSSRVLKGVTPKKREPTREKPVVIGDVKTAGVEHSAERASADEQREDELRAEAREAQSRGAVITFQRPVELPANAQGSQEVAEIRRAAGEDVANDSDSLSGIIAQQIAQAASANGIR